MAVIKAKADKLIRLALPIMERNLVSPYLTTRIPDGAFVGAAAGGYLSQHADGTAVFVLGVGLTLAWLAASATMAAPPARYRTNYSMGET